jgi:hypothetical protein
MKIKFLLGLFALSLSLSGCFLEKRTNSGGDSGDYSYSGGGGDDDSGDDSDDNTVTKPLTSSDWIEGSSSIDMQNAVTDGSSFNAERVSGPTTCDCTMTMTGSESTGSYTSTCTAVMGGNQSDCDFFTTDPATQCTPTTLVPEYEYTGRFLTFNPCGPHTSALHFY